MCNPNIRGLYCSKCKFEWDMKQKADLLTGDKEQKLAIALVEFKDSKQLSNDYLKLLVSTTNTIIMRDGLTWNKVEDIIKEVIEGIQSKSEVKLEIVERNVPTRFLTTPFGELNLEDVLLTIGNLEGGEVEFHACDSDIRLKDYLVYEEVIIESSKNTWIATEKLERFAEIIRSMSWGKR
jgi:hypothetical protein